MSQESINLNSKNDLNQNFTPSEKFLNVNIDFK